MVTNSHPATNNGKRKMINELQYFQSMLSSVWPEWKITKRLGKGSYGSVYEIQRDVFGTRYKCALKILHMEVENLEPGEMAWADFGKISSTKGFDSTASTDTAVQKAFRQLPDLGGKTLIPGMSFEDSAQIYDHAMGNGSDLNNSNEELDDFVRSVSTEIDMMMQLKGAPNIVTIEDYTVLSGTGSRTIMIRMELLESVDQHIKRCGALSREEVIQLGLDICSALEACEQKNILHRDIKPSNIFYSEQAGFKLGDFGISRTMSSIYSKMSMSEVGTIQFMAPEVYFGREYDNTVDIYSLGVVLYTLMNNNTPPLYQKEPSDMDLAAERSRLHKANIQRLKGEAIPFPANASGRLGNAICMACNPDPSRRFQTARGFQNALKSVDGSDNPPLPPENKHWKKIIIASAVCICILSIAIFFIPVIFKHDTVSYTVLYEDESGNVIDKITGTGKAGQVITVEGNTIEGYTLLSEPTEIVLSTKKDDNNIVIKYSKIVVSPSEPTDSPEKVTYTVLSTDLDGATLARQVKEGAIGEEITEYPTQIEGYSCSNSSETITLSETDEDNEIIFLYEKDDAENTVVVYTVLCVDRENGEQLEKSTYYGSSGDTIRFQAPYIDGYTAKNEEISIVLSDDETQNIFNFLYESDANLMDIPSSNTLYYNGHTYYAMRTSSIDSFWDAKSYCEDRGGYLAVISNASENEALYDYVFYDRGYQSAYFGYTDEDSEGSWYWINGSSNGYENWLKGQPDNSNGSEDYALFYYKDMPYKWNDGDFGKDSSGTVTFLIEWDA